MLEMVRMMVDFVYTSMGYVVVDMPPTDDPPATDTNSLFPTKGKVDHHHSSTGSLTPTLCLTGLTTHILPFKNENGELEWTFADAGLANATGDEYSAFKLSPTLSHESLSKSLSTHPSSENLGGAIDDDKVYACPHCQTTFKIKGYLTRHMKKHATKKAYLCPFRDFTTYVDKNNTTHRCHPNGGFSRRDTYKTHLKLRHFKYPKGTRTKERSTSAGLCGLCGEFFNNSEIWCEIHIEGGQCKFLPSGFKGKLRILKKLEKQAKLGIPQDLGIHNYDIAQFSSSSSANTSGVDLTPGITPGANLTPLELSPGGVLPPIHHMVGQPTPAIYSYNHSLPTVSILLSIPPLKLPPVSMPQQPPQQMQQLPPPPYPQFAEQLVMAVPTSDYNHLTTTIEPVLDDYDDEFCLDTDQLYYDYPKMMEVPMRWAA